MEKKRNVLVAVFGMCVATFSMAPFQHVAAQVQTVPMVRFDGGPLPKWAQGTLRRDDTGVTMMIETRARGELIDFGVPQGVRWRKGDAVIHWFLNFNDPSAFTAPCDLDDVLAELEPAPQATWVSTTPRDILQPAASGVLRPSSWREILPICSLACPSSMR